MGYDIVGKGYNGNEGFSAYVEYKPDLTFLDITMPIKDGKTCLQEIKEYDPDAKVIIVSALSDKTTMNDCEQMGAIGLIPKIYLNDPTAFKILLDEVLVKVKKAS